jgi:hypothetical protein
MDGMRIYKYNPYFILPIVLFVLLMSQPVNSVFNKLLIYKDYQGAIILVLVVDYFLMFFIRHIYDVLRGTPAIIITREFIFIGKKGYTIAWRDIESIDKVQGLKMSLRKTWRNWPQIKNPVVRIYYGYIASGISIPGILIAGDAEQMSITIRDYYFKYRYD